MNPKIFVGVAIAAVVASIAIVMTFGASMLNEGMVPAPGGEPPEVAPVTVTIDDMRVLELDRDGATLEIVVTLDNPNPKSVILSLVKYQIFEGGERVAAGQIGARSQGMVDASDYYTILSNGSVTLRDKISLINAGGAPRFWDALESGDVSWRVTGEAFFNLSSMTVGQENVVAFEQTLGPGGQN